MPLIQKIMERNGLSGNGTRAHFTKNTGPPSKYYNGTNSLHCCQVSGGRNIIPKDLPRLKDCNITASRPRKPE